jgi:AcrR family transcriptional regulator
MCETPSSKRHAAGTNPALRQRILEGAAGVFMDRGFDAAGMNDICRASGVSKSTLYVYFAHKEDLFAALIEQKRDPKFNEIQRALYAAPDADAAIKDFLTCLVTVVCSPEVIRVQRTIIGIAARMPELGARFYEGGAERAQKLLRGYLDLQVTLGRYTITDTSRAAHQLIEMASAGLLRQCLYGIRTSAPEEAEVHNAVQAAMSVFDAAYKQMPE